MKNGYYVVKTGIIEVCGNGRKYIDEGGMTVIGGGEVFLEDEAIEERGEFFENLSDAVSFHDTQF